MVVPRKSKSSYALAYERELQEYVALLQRGEAFTGSTSDGEETNATAPKGPPKIADMLARHIIGDFCERAWKGQKQNSVVISWIADVLDEILDAGKPDARKAFSLMPRREGRSGSADSHLDIACWVALTIRLGYTPAEAHQLASDKFHKDVKFIRRLCRSEKETLQSMEPLPLEKYFERKSRPLPSPKRGTQSR